MKIIVGITGASGVVYGIRLLEVLRERNTAETYLIVSESAKKIIAIETDYELEEIYALASHVYDNSDLTAPLSSGSVRHDGAIIAPCSMKTLGCIAAGISTTLITRAAEVCLKESRKLVIIPREAPLSLIHLENMVTVKKAGAILLPASPAFYHKPKTVLDMADFIVARALDVFGIELGTGKENGLIKRWKHL
ncbi:putative UbiX-like flavin prenyltransferase [subsurface metagenome]|nr:UbiX family flavin prenyltransferase [Methanomicrobia archaeon]MQY54510.1 UbiX family flavin prenyltransferase [Methanosarcinales archaeon]